MPRRSRRRSPRLEAWSCSSKERERGKGEGKLYYSRQSAYRRWRRWRPQEGLRLRLFFGVGKKKKNPSLCSTVIRPGILFFFIEVVSSSPPAQYILRRERENVRATWRGFNCYTHFCCSDLAVNRHRPGTKSPSLQPHPTSILRERETWHASFSAAGDFLIRAFNRRIKRTSSVPEMTTPAQRWFRNPLRTSTLPVPDTVLVLFL